MNETSALSATIPNGLAMQPEMGVVVVVVVVAASATWGALLETFSLGHESKCFVGWTNIGPGSLVMVHVVG